jgi:transposase
MSRRFFDESFKKMAIELSYAKGGVKPVAEELGIRPALLTKWRLLQTAPVDNSKSLTDEQKEIKRLQKELKEAQLERDILKKAVGIFSKGDGRYSDL